MNYTLTLRSLSLKNRAKEAEIVLNGAIVNENNKKYYYVYKPGSRFEDSESNKKILLDNNILYSYIYFTPGKIRKIKDIKHLKIKK